MSTLAPSPAYDRGDYKDEYFIENLIKSVDDSPEPWELA